MYFRWISLYWQLIKIVKEKRHFRSSPWMKQIWTVSNFQFDVKKCCVGLGKTFVFYQGNGWRRYKPLCQANCYQSYWGDPAPPRKLQIWTALKSIISLLKIKQESWVKLIAFIFFSFFRDITSSFSQLQTKKKVRTLQGLNFVNGFIHEIYIFRGDLISRIVFIQNFSGFRWLWELQKCPIPKKKTKPWCTHNVSTKCTKIRKEHGKHTKIAR